MKKSVPLLAFLAVCVGASAQTVLFNISLTGAEGATPSGSTATGSGTATLDLGAHTLTLNNISFSGLSSNSTIAHIHGPATSTQDAGIIYDLGSYFTSGGTSGAFNGTINFVTGAGGYSVSTQETQLQSGLWYINVHTGTFSGGEIRGQLSAVPEPGTTAALMGVLAIAFCVWRRRFEAA